MDDAFSVDDLIACYARGVFPMADAREDESVFLIDPERRGVLPLGDFHIPKRLARTVRNAPYEVRVDTAFDAVVEACAASRPGRVETWINHPIQRLYGQLYARGLAHSVETWVDGELAGGLYGVAIGRAMFGESMFAHRTDASKIALAALVCFCRRHGIGLIDCQQNTRHLASLGAREWPRSRFLAHVDAARVLPPPAAWRFEPVYWNELLPPRPE